MWLQSLHFRNYRSIQRTSLLGFKGMNVLIGKNNAGKTTAVSGVVLLHDTLKQGTAAREWLGSTAKHQFTDRDTSRALQIAGEFALTKSSNEMLRAQLLENSPQLANAIAALEACNVVSVILRAYIQGAVCILYVQSIHAGSVDAGGEELCGDGAVLFSMSHQAASLLAQQHKALNALAAERAALQRVLDNPQILEETARRGDPSFIRLYSHVLSPMDEGAPLRAAARLAPLFRPKASVEEMREMIRQVTLSIDEETAALSGRELDASMQSFAGMTRIIPPYVTALMRRIGEARLLHLGESRKQIGRREASELLGLKVKRGGEQRLRNVQTTVQALLGVTIDAFEADSPSESGRSAELDVDNFLVDANGAGVREALRLIIDLELNGADVALIEEPEVHLHPGLERTLESYLRESSKDVQFFLTTHSTNFVDAVAFQNVYLVQRDSEKHTTCDSMGESDGPWKIPAEVGLRLSMVFMFDRLAFVEGPSDEAVLRALAAKLRIDLTGPGVGFVKMGGVRNFAHYAAEGTLDLLSRRRIPLTFIADRDEREDVDVAKMLHRLGDRAKLFVLTRRELENYLVVPGPVTRFLREKRRLAGAGGAPEISEEAVKLAINESADELKGEVIRLRVEQKLLQPVFPSRYEAGESVQQKLKAASDAIASRQGDAERVTAETARDVEAGWAEHRLNWTPGAALLDRVARRFGLRFNKDAGDGLRLAEEFEPGQVSTELRTLLLSVTEG